MSSPRCLVQKPPVGDEPGHLSHVLFFLPAPHAPFSLPYLHPISLQQPPVGDEPGHLSHVLFILPAPDAGGPAHGHAPPAQQPGAGAGGPWDAWGICMGGPVRWCCMEVEELHETLHAVPCRDVSCLAVPCYATSSCSVCFEQCTPSCQAPAAPAPAPMTCCCTHADICPASRPPCHAPATPLPCHAPARFCSCAG